MAVHCPSDIAATTPFLHTIKLKQLSHYSMIQMQLKQELDKPADGSCNHLSLGNFCKILVFLKGFKSIKNISAFWRPCAISSSVTATRNNIQNAPIWTQTAQVSFKTIFTDLHCLTLLLEYVESFVAIRIQLQPHKDYLQPARNVQLLLLSLLTALLTNLRYTLNF